jgi:hypothetical protein
MTDDTPSASDFGQDPSSLPVLSQSFPITARPNVQAALDAYLERPGREMEMSCSRTDVLEARAHQDAPRRHAGTGYVIFERR